MQNRQTIKRFAGLLLVLALAAAMLCGCSSSSSTAMYNTAQAPMRDTGSYETDLATEYGAEPSYLAEDALAAGGEAASNHAGGPTFTQPQDGRKVIMTAWLNMESLAFDETCATLQQAAQEHGGYISATNISNNSYDNTRNASITIKVPIGNYAALLQQVEASGNVTNRSESSDDVTQQYVDVESRLNSYQRQKQRLEELVEQAETLADLLEIEAQLAEVQYQIEYYTTSLRNLDELTAYSTVNVSVQEVKEITQPKPETYFDRIGRAFQESWQVASSFFQQLFIALIYMLPFLLVLAVLVVIILLIVRRAKKHRALHPKPQPGLPPPPVYGQGYVAPAQPSTPPATGGQADDTQDSNPK